MVQFFVDKENKVPLYLQLMDEVKYYISTGMLRGQEQLPPVKILAKTLGINFLTVRKAYKELEKAGLLDIRQGEGTFISLTNPLPRNGKMSKRNGSVPRPDIHTQFAAAARVLFEQYLKQGVNLVEAKKITEEIFVAIERNSSMPFVVFAECNQFQIDEISGILEEELKLEVRPSLVADLEKNIPRWMNDGREINIVTTGFHVDKVRRAVGEMPIQIDVLITNLHPETRRRIEAFGENGKYGFVCRDEESAAVYKDLLKAELGYKQIKLVACTLAETAKVQTVIHTSDVVLVSPWVYEAVRKISAPEKPIYNILDRVDPMSLKVVKDRILGDRKF